MTQLRTPTLDDLAQVSIWSADQELASLDPPAGVAMDPLLWSVYTDEGVHIGFISIYNREGSVAEIGIRLGEKTYWGQGHGTNAVREVLKYCPYLGVAKVHLKVLPTNVRAIRCYEKCGFFIITPIIIDNIYFLYMEITLG